MSPLPAVGHKSFALICKEATLGTAPAAATAKFELVNFEFSTNQSTAEDPSMSSAGYFPRAIEQGLQFVTGKFRVKVGFEGFEELWRMVLPSYSSSVVSGSVIDHTFKEGVTLSSYTIDISMGDVPTSKVTRFLGCFLTGFRFSIAAASGESGLLIADIEFAAASVANTVTPMTTIAVANLVPIAYHRLLRTTGNLNDGTSVTESSIYLRSLSLAIRIPHETANGYLGSVWADQPFRNGVGSGKLDIEMRWDANSLALMTALTANSPAALTFFFQHPTTIGSSSKRELQLTMSSPCSADYGVAVQGAGMWIQKASYGLAYNTSDASALKVRARSLTAALA